MSGGWTNCPSSICPIGGPPIRCDMVDGHAGSHYDQRTGAEWTDPRVATDTNVDRDQLRQDVLDGSYPDALDADGRKAPHEVKHLCWKVCEQAGKGQWFNVLSALSALVNEATKGLRTELARKAGAP